MNSVIESCVLRCLVLRVLLDADRKGAGGLRGGQPPRTPPRPLPAELRSRMAAELRERTLLVQAARGGF